MLKKLIFVTNVLVITAAILFSIVPLMAEAFLGVQVTRVMSGSMEPTIKTSDLIVTRPVTPGEIEPGAIVGINREVSVTHRVIARDADGTLTTMGDNNPAADQIQPTEADLWGVLFFIIPQPLAGVVSSYTTTPEWRVQLGHVVTGHWDDLAELSDGAPWGFIVTIGVFVLTSILESLLKFAEAHRREDEGTEHVTAPRTVKAAAISV